MYFTTYYTFFSTFFASTVATFKTTRLKSSYQHFDELFPLTTTTTTYFLDGVSQGLARARSQKPRPKTAITKQIQCRQKLGHGGRDDRFLPDLGR